jgi:hypothetical protein
MDGNLVRSGPVRIAARDAGLRAVVVDRFALRYDHGPAPHLDRPAHVRAASSLVFVGHGHVIVQDDALFLGSVGFGGLVGVELPAPDGVRQFEKARGNKKLKPDLEAACRWDGPTGPVVVAFGSGSKSVRERVLLAPADRLDAAQLVDAGPLYAALRACLPADAELNVEGAIQVGRRLRLLQRGNGRGNFDAWLDIDGSWVDALLAGKVEDPVVTAVVRWELGEIGGVRLTWTDGAAIGGERILFSATAEASPDAIEDGGVAGSAVGWADDAGGRWAPLTDPEGRVLADKLEGVALRRVDDAGAEVWGVVDADDPDRPSDLLQIRLEGEGWGLRG